MIVPLNPNGLFDAVTRLNQLAAQLCDQGWQVKLRSTEDGSRMWVQISTTRSCDPAQESKR